MCHVLMVNAFNLIKYYSINVYIYQCDTTLIMLVGTTALFLSNDSYIPNQTFSFIVCYE